VDLDIILAVRSKRRRTVRGKHAQDFMEVILRTLDKRAKLMEIDISIVRGRRLERSLFPTKIERNSE